MSDKKKIAFVGNDSFSMYNFRIGVMRHFMKDYEVVVIASKNDYAELFRKEGIRYISLGMENKGTNAFKDLRLMKNLYQVYKAEKFDFVLNYTIKPIIYGSIVCSMLKIKNIAITAGLGFAFMKDNLMNKMVKVMYKFALKKVCEIWFLNKDDRDLFIENNLVKKEKTFVLNSEGVDMEHFSPMEKSEPDKFKFLLFSRLIGEKGIREYVSAAKQLKSKYPNIDFMLLGKIEDVDNSRAITQQEVDEWEKEGIIEYKGYHLEVRQFIADSDCVVLPSYYREGVPRSLMEAMSMEKPIIATNNVGCVELVEDGVNGYLCEPKSAEDLMEKMERLYLLSEAERKAMGEAGRNIIKQRFDENIIISEYQKRLSQYM